MKDALVQHIFLKEKGYKKKKKGGQTLQCKYDTHLIEDTVERQDKGGQTLEHEINRPIL